MTRDEARDESPGRMGGTPERPARFFDTPEEFCAWLALHHDTATELWMGLKKMHVADRGLTWEQAVPEALCWGWIDSVVQRIDDGIRRQRWTPRKKASHWSKINLDLVEKLRVEGRMQPSGLAIWEQRRREEAGYSQKGPEVGLPDSYATRFGCLSRGHGLLGDIDRDLPQVLHGLGDLGQAGVHPRPPDDPTDRELRRRRSRAEPALRRRAELGAAGRGGRRSSAVSVETHGGGRGVDP